MRLAASAGYQDPRLERLRSLIRSEFAVDLYVPDENDDILKPPGGGAYDLRPAPALMKLEMQYAMQCRHDARQGAWRGFSVNSVCRSVAGYSDSDSFSEIEAPASLYTDARHAWHYVTKLLRELYDDSGPWDKEVWDFRDFGIQHGSNMRRYLDFSVIPQLWLRNIAKSWLRYYMSRGVSSSLLSKQFLAVSDLGCWLAQHHPSVQNPRGVTRAALETYIVHVRTGRSSTFARRRLLALKAFFEESEEHQLAEFSGRIYSSDIPRQAERKPRAIDEFVMQQLETPAALALIEQPESRVAIELLMLCGMRISECCGLPFNPLSFDSAGAPVLTTRITKTGDAENSIPVSDRVSQLVQEQQQRVIARFGHETAVLFPRRRSNPDGEFPTSPQIVSRHLEIWLATINATDRLGHPAHITPHQFRHTLGTRMVNQGVSLTVIKSILGHKTIEMTEHYARINDKTVRQAFELFSASRVNTRGELLKSTCSDVEWTKERLGRALVTTQNGYCGRPLRLECPHPNACLTCPDFLTDLSFLPAHRLQLAETQRLITAAELAGNTRQLEMNRKVMTNLETIISTLECCESQKTPDAAS